MIGALCESVGLWMVGSRMFVVDLELSSELGPETGDKGGAAVGDDGVGKTMVTEDAIEEKPGKTGGVERLGGGNEVGVTSKAVDNDPDSSVDRGFA